MATDEIKQTIVIEASLTKIQQDLKKLEGNFKASFASIQSAANSVLGGLGISLSGAAIVGFVKTSVGEIGKLQDAFERTGVSADILLKLRPILENSGSSVEEFANSVNAMQKQLVDGSADTIEAFSKVGIAANDILKLAEDPEELLDRVAKGLANVATQTERVAIARQLASRAGGRIAPALLELAKGGGLEGLRQEKGVISKEDIAAIDEAGDTINTAFIKAQAIAAKSFVTIINDYKDLSQYIQEHPIRFIFNIDGGFFELAGKLRQLRADVASATAGSKIGGAAKLIEGGGGAGLKETNAQRDFKKALDEQIDSLRSQVLGLNASKEAAIANAAEIIKTKAAAIGLTESSEELNKRLAEFKAQSLKIAQSQFADQLTKANQSLRIQIVTMTEGKDAADDLALKYTIANAKLEDMGDAARKAAERQKELNKELAEAVVPQIANTLESETNQAQLKVKPGDVSTNLAGLTRDALQKANDALDAIIADKLTSASVKTLATDLKLKIEPQLDDRKLDAIKEQVLIDFTLAERKADVLNKVFGNSFDETAAKIEALKGQLENALKVDRGADKTPQAHEAVLTIGAKLDQAQLDKAFDDINRQLEVADAQAVIFGRSFDLAGARVQAVEGNLNELLTRGLKPSTEEAKQLGEQLRNLKVADIFSDLRKNLEDISADAEILGGSIDLPSETIDALTDALKRLRTEGFGPLSPEIQRVKEQLEDAKAAERFAEAFQGIGRSVIDSLQDLADGAKLKDVAKRLASNINRAITDALITKPFEDWIKSQTNNLFGGILKLPIPGAGTAPGAQSVGIPGAAAGAAGQIAGAAQTQPGIIAIQAVAAEASTSIQTSSVTTQASIQAISTESTVGIQATLAVAETTITTLGATTEASIAALQAVAIAAIEAAAAAQAVSSGAKSSIPLIGSVGAQLAPAAVHGGGPISPTMISRRFHAGGAVSPAIDLSRVSHFHAGGIIGPQNHSNLQSTALRFHQGGAVKTDLTDNSIHSISRFHAGGAIGPAINSVQLSNVAHSNLARFHTGGAIGPTINASHLTNIMNPGRFHQGGIISPAAKDRGDVSNVSHFHAGGIIATRPATNQSNVARESLPRFHDGGQMWSGASKTAGGELKAGERMIIAEDGEFVINKRTAAKIGMENLQKLNRAEATVTPRLHFGGAISPAINVVQLSRIAPRFHFGGTIQAFSNTVATALARFHNGGIIASTHVAVNPQLKFPRFHQGGAVLRSALALPKYHDGGTVSSTERWSGTSADLSYMKQTGTISDAWMIPAGTSRGQNNGPTANIAVFNNPQFQNRQAVGQTSAQLAAAMESGKRNR